MILYNDEQDLSLEKYGILIPVHSSKTTKTFEALLSHPLLGAVAERWHLRPETLSIGEADLLRVHDPRYVQRLFSQEVEQEMIRTFELIDENGQPNRYAPDRAERPMTHLFQRILETASGTWQCCRLALEHGFCFFFGGGMHHAQRSKGNGFCLINDIVIALDPGLFLGPFLSSGTLITTQATGCRHDEVTNPAQLVNDVVGLTISLNDTQNGDVNMSCFHQLTELIQSVSDP